MSDAQRGNVLEYFATCVFIAVRLWNTIVYICILFFMTHEVTVADVRFTPSLQFFLFELLVLRIHVLKRR